MWSTVACLLLIGHDTFALPAYTAIIFGIKAKAAIPLRREDTESKILRNPSSPVNTSSDPETTASSPEYLPLYRPSRQISFCAWMLFAMLASLLIGPMFDRFTTEVFGGSTSLADLWIIRSNIRDLLSLPWFDMGAGYPFGGTLAWGDNLIFPSFLLSPLIANGVSAIVACNALFFLSAILNGWCSFRLAYQLTGTISAALLAGIAFMTAPMFWGSLSGPLLSCMFILPLAISAVLRLIATPRLRYGFVLGILLTIAAFTSVAVTILTILSSVLLAFSFLVLHPHRWYARPLLPPLFGVFLGLVPTIAIIVPLAAAHGVVEPIASDLLAARSATLRSFAPLRPHHLFLLETRAPQELELTIGWLVLLGAILALRRLSDSSSLFIRLLIAALCSATAAALGQSTLIPVVSLLSWLALVAGVMLMHRLGQLERRLAVQIVTNRDLISMFFFLAIFFLLFSLGPVETFANVGRLPSVFTVVNHLGLRLLPIGFPSVGGVGVALALSIVAAFTVARFVRIFSPWRFIVPLLGLLMTVESYRVVSSTPLPSPTNIERYLENVDVHGGVVAALPFPAAGSTAAPFLNSIFSSRLSSINLHTDRLSPYLSALTLDTRNFPNARSIRALAAIAGLRYIVATDPTPEKGALIASAAQFADSIRYLESDGTGRFLFEFHPETTLREEFILYVPAHRPGVLHAELRALYETGEPHVPLKLEWRDGRDWRSFSEAVVTANGQWAAYSFPLPAPAASTPPLEIRFVAPERSRVSIRHTGFVPVD